MSKGEQRLMVDITASHMKILNYIKESIGIPKKGIVNRALRDYFYKHRQLLKQKKKEEFLIEYLEGK